MANLFIRIYNYFEKHRNAFYLSLLFSFAAVTWFALKVKFEEDISKVLPKDKKTEKLNEVFQNSRFLDRLVMMVSLKDTSATAQLDSLTDYAAQFVTSVHKNLAPYILKINDKVDDHFTLDLFNTINSHLPLFLNEKDYRAIDTLTRPHKIKETLEQDYRTLVSPAGIALKQMISNDPVGLSFLGLKKMQQLQYDDNFELYNDYVVT